MRQFCHLKSLKFFILASLALQAGCASQATVLTEKLAFKNTVMPTECGGWEKIEIKTRTRYYMMREDQTALVNIDAHNLRGKNLGCWGDR